MARVRDILPLALSASLSTAIGRRQTTYWDLEPVDPAHQPTRVHFIGKVEHCYVSARFAGASLFQEHPILADYVEPTLTLYVSNVAARPELALAQLAQRVREWSHGWRALARYQNQECDPLSILLGGYGLLMSGPSSLIRRAEELLAEHGASPNVLPSHAKTRQLQVLCLGESFVVAQHFDFEPLSRRTA